MDCFKYGAKWNKYLVSTKQKNEESGEQNVSFDADCNFQGK